MFSSNYPKVSKCFIVHKKEVLPYSSSRKIPAEVDCEISNPCPRKFYKVDLQREIAELNPDTSTVILVFDPEFRKEELVNDYDLFQFLADSGGAMGKSIKFLIDICLDNPRLWLNKQHICLLAGR